MAHPLRIERVGGRFHATARGNERRELFRDDADRYHFLELLSDMPARFGVRLHPYALMNNHFHLLKKAWPSAVGPVLTRQEPWSHRKLVAMLSIMQTAMSNGPTPRPRQETQTSLAGVQFTSNRPVL
jgi:REP element-mobilizing transposase RayT